MAQIQEGQGIAELDNLVNETLEIPDDALHAQEATINPDLEALLEEAVREEEDAIPACEATKQYLKQRLFKNPIIDTQKLGDFTKINEYVDSLSQTQGEQLCQFMQSMDGTERSEEMAKSFFQGAGKYVERYTGIKNYAPGAFVNKVANDESLQQEFGAVIGGLLVYLPRPLKIAAYIAADFLGAYFAEGNEANKEAYQTAAGIPGTGDCPYHQEGPCPEEPVEEEEEDNSSSEEGPRSQN